ncbi:hypothetical protein HZH66_004492 [Vespula vulgaris]|uniref:Uncharacterized protein n=1 Tax=Vespula vulgaris TaxID=7454 RepID=A0A834KK83_VESVU|nr:hypothetical protein HZH66_004492 [Vespula vulgaris]
MQTNESYFAEVFNKLLYLRRVRYYAKVATLLTKMYNYHPLTNNMARFLAIVNINKILFEFLDFVHSHGLDDIHDDDDDDENDDYDYDDYDDRDDDYNADAAAAATAVDDDDDDNDDDDDDASFE